MNTQFIKLTLGIAALTCLAGARAEAATSAVSCEEIFSNQHQYVSLVSAGAHLSENPAPFEFTFTLLSDRVVIRAMGAFAETAEGRRVFPPIEYPVRRAWRIVVNPLHRLVMVLGNEPLMLAFDERATNVNQGWTILNPESSER